MVGTSTGGAIFESACRSVPADVQVWKLENTAGFVGVVSTPPATVTITVTGGVPFVTTNITVVGSTAASGGIPLICCTVPSTPDSVLPVECDPQNFATLATLATAADLPTTVATVEAFLEGNPNVCGTIACGANPGNATVTPPTFFTATPVIVNAAEVAFSNYDCTRRCWTPHTLDDIAGFSPQDPTPSNGIVPKPCRVYLTAGSWIPTAISSVTNPLDPGAVIVGASTVISVVGNVITLTIDPVPVKVEILKGLDAIIDAFVSCNPLCTGSLIGSAGIPDLLVDTSTIIYAFNKGGYCDNYFDADGLPIRSAGQLISLLLNGEDILFDCAITTTLGANLCGCTCGVSSSAIVINLCDFPCLASRLICTEKLKWVLDGYVANRRRRTTKGLCDFGVV